VPIAIGLGWVLSRKSFRGKHLLESVVFLPLVLPPVTIGYVLLYIFGKTGLLKPLWILLGTDGIAFTFWAAVLAALVVSLPLFVRSVKASFDMVDPMVEKAANTLGANRWKVFRTISLPMALPGVLSGFILSFARCWGEFGATITFAGNMYGKTQTLPLAIYSSMQVPGREFVAAKLVLVSIVISLVTMYLSERMIKKI
jgi:molybdate transport system permease protein